MHELVEAGEVRRKDAEKVVRELLENSREASERVRVAVRDEVTRQFGAMVSRLDQVESLIEQLIARMAPTGAGVAEPSSFASTDAPPARSSPADPVANGRASGTSTPVESTPAENPPVEMAMPAQVPARKAPAKKARAKPAVASKARAKPTVSGTAPAGKHAGEEGAGEEGAGREGAGEGGGRDHVTGEGGCGRLGVRANGVVERARR